MKDNEQLLQTAWQFWHAGTGIDVEDMPPPNPSFKAGFDYGMVAAHNEHCAALIKVEELSTINAALEKLKMTQPVNTFVLNNTQTAV